MQPLNNVDNYLPLVTLQEEHNDLAPILCVPGAGGSVANFLSLVNALKTDRSVYGFQPRGLDGVHAPHDSVSSAAECYVRAFDAAWENKAVNLLGHSFGGWIVFDMAEKFLAMGRKVESLIIVDSDAPDKSDATAKHLDEVEILLKFINIVEQMVEQPIQINESELRSSSKAGCREIIHQRMVKFGLFPKQSNADVLTGIIQTFSSCLRISYIPKQVYPYLTHLVLMNEPKLDAEQNKKKHLKCVEGWRLWAPNLVVWYSPGNHMTAFKYPHVNIVAGWLQKTVLSSEDIRIYY